jgi:hypothetical protein
MMIETTACSEAVYEHDIRGIPMDSLGLLLPRTLLFGLSFDSGRRIRCKRI